MNDSKLCPCQVQHCKESNTDSTHRDISLVSQAQYDTISCQVKSQNVIARFDTVKSWQSMGEETHRDISDTKDISHSLNMTTWHDRDFFASPQNNKTPNFTIKTLKESFLKTGRLDSEYYQDKYEKIESFIKSHKGGNCYLKNIGVFSNGSFIPESYYVAKSKRAYVRIKELSFNAPINIQECVYIDDGFKTTNETVVKENDFVFATIGNTIGKVNIIPKILEGSFISNNTTKFVLNDKFIKPYFLELLLRSILVQTQIQRESTQTAQPKISNTSLENILIPLIDITIQQKIEAKILQSFALRTKSKELLEQAKQRVDEAISKS